MLSCYWKIHTEYGRGKKNKVPLTFLNNDPADIPGTATIAALFK